MDLGGVPSLSLPPDLEAFKRLIASSGKRKGGASNKFVKKVDIPSIEIPIERIYRSTLNIAEQGLIGQFTGLWPSLKAIEG